MDPAHEPAKEERAPSGSSTAAVLFPPPSTLEHISSAFNVEPVHDLILAECGLAQAFRHYEEATRRMGLVPNWQQVLQRHVGLGFEDEGGSLSAAAGSGASESSPLVVAQAEQSTKMADSQRDLEPASPPTGAALASAPTALTASSAITRAWPMMDKSDGASTIFYSTKRSPAAYSSAPDCIMPCPEQVQEASPDPPEPASRHFVAPASPQRAPEIPNLKRQEDTAADDNGVAYYLRSFKTGYELRPSAHSTASSAPLAGPSTQHSSVSPKKRTAKVSGIRTRPEAPSRSPSKGGPVCKAPPARAAASPASSQPTQQTKRSCGQCGRDSTGDSWRKSRLNRSRWLCSSCYHREAWQLKKEKIQALKMIDDGSLYDSIESSSDGDADVLLAQRR
ncbi:hypothetical protein OC842_005871 [Tilletia horrida]|uniref:Uncharacterized protein n=1 Tax=Tilletia horrida TaxID=155126 RepID=A0AAN6G6Y2_9BASI|nr:hypothetical protein OC842_005871 [Tilletia horrida]